MNQTLMPIQDIYGYTHTVAVEDWIGTTYEDNTAIFEFANEDYHKTIVVTFFKAIMINKILDKVLER